MRHRTWRAFAFFSIFGIATLAGSAHADPRTMQRQSRSAPARMQAAQRSPVAQARAGRLDRQEQQARAKQVQRAAPPRSSDASRQRASTQSTRTVRAARR